MDNMKMGDVVLLEPDSLKPFEDNAKLHPEEQIAALAKIINEQGFRNKPVEITPDGTIVNGHGRWMAVKKLGWSKIPCVIIDDMTPSQIRKYRISDNKLADTGFDNMKLKVEMEMLYSEGVDFSDIFNEKELDFLTGDLSEMNMEAITEDLSEDVKELSEDTQSSIDEEDQKTVPVSKVLGFGTVTESQRRNIAKLLAHAEGVTSERGAEALSRYAKDHIY